MATILREYRCRSRLLEVAVLLLVSGALSVILNAAGLLRRTSPGEVAALFLVGGAALIFGSWLLVADMRWPGRIVLTDTGIRVPRGLPPSAEVLVPYSQIRGVWHKETPDFRQIGLQLAKGRMILPTLQVRQEEEELIRFLGERLEPLHVTVEVRPSAFVNGRFRPQFSLRWVFVFTTLVALALGTLLYFDPHLKPGKILGLCCVGLLCGIPCLALFVPSRRWWALYVAYWLGAGLETWAFLRVYVPWYSRVVFPAIPGARGPGVASGYLDGWYPLLVPLQRWLVTAWGVDADKAVWYAGGADVLFSAVAAGLAGLGLSYAVEQIVKRTRETRLPETSKPEETLP